MIEQELFEEAEQLLLDSADALQADDDAPKRQVDETISQLVDLYERWGRSEEANAWRELLNLEYP